MIKRKCGSADGLSAVMKGMNDNGKHGKKGV